MYLAIKWLIFLGLVMWALLCCIDLYLMKNYSKDTYFSSMTTSVNKNNQDREKLHFVNHQRQSIINYLTFIAGALAVTLYNRKCDIVRYIIRTVIIYNFYVRQTANLLISWIKHMTIRLSFRKILKTFCLIGGSAMVNLQKRLNPQWQHIKSILMDFTKVQVPVENEDNTKRDRTLLLLKRLKEVGQERNRLGQLLVVAIRENKNMRLQCYFESQAKKRLLLQIQDTQKQIKETRSKYINYQQLHLMTQQEILYLKNRIKKISKDKEEADANLMKLISRVYKSKDNNLKAYCTCFVVNNKENLLWNEMNANEMNVFQKRFIPGPSVTKNENDEANTDDLASTSAKEISNDTKEIVHFAVEETKPKSQHTPGEYVWTIKNKNGIIEKMYEYDYGFNFDNGDSIKRIREYSVHHDSDCLLDMSRAKGSIKSIDCSNIAKQSTNMPQRRFLTGSPVFQQFLESSRNFAVSKAPSPPLLCG